MIILTRTALETLSCDCTSCLRNKGTCTPGLAQHAVRAKEQEGQDFGDGIVGNGIDTYYPNGFGDDEWRRIASVSAPHARWLAQHAGKLGLPEPSAEVRAEIHAAMKARWAR